MEKEELKCILVKQHGHICMTIANRSEQGREVDELYRLKRLLENLIEILNY
jgi:hypothetical protein